MEIYKSINGKYSISNFWNIRNNFSNKVLRWCITTEWYISFLFNWKRKFVHRLVAELFLDKTDNDTVVNHKNWIKHDNRVENLEWCTHSQNSLHTFRILWRKHIRVNNSKKVYKILDDWTEILYNSIKEASIENKISWWDISACCLGNRKTAGWFTWKHFIW